MAKASRAADTTSDSESESSQADNGSALVLREAEEASGDEDEDTEKSDGGSSSEEEDSDDDSLPPMKLFSSLPVNAPVPLSTAEKKAGADASSGSVSDDASSDTSSSDSDSDSSSSDSGDDKDAADAPLAQLSVETDADEDADTSNALQALSTQDDGHAGGPDESSDSSDSSVADEDGDSSTRASKNIKSEQSDAEPAQETAAATNGDVDSSEDGLDEIPFSLPPGTNPDVQVPDVQVPDGSGSGSDITKEAIEDATEETPIAAEDEHNLNLLYAPIASPRRPARARLQRATAVGSSQDKGSRSQPSKKRASKQVAKEPYVEGRSAADEDKAGEGATAEPMSVDNVEAADVIERTQESQSQESQAAAAEALAGSPPDAPVESPRKRKRRLLEDPADDNENPETPAPATSKKTAKKTALMTPSAAAASPKKTKKVAQTPKASRPRTPAAPGSSLKKGPQGNFTPEEVERMKRGCEKYMEENQMSQADFNVMVHEKATKYLSFWAELASEFPDHKRLQVILRCRRIYHNFSQAYKWTPEQDAELAELVGKHGNKWLIIGGLMDRSSEDVRKRWDEYVVCGDKVQSSYWRFDEEKALGRVVGEVLKTVQQSRGQSTAAMRKSIVDDIPWHLVSERMGFTRTARQCRIKWRAIQEAYHFTADGDLVGPPDPENLTRSQVRAEKLKDLGRSTAQSPVPISSPLKAAAASTPKPHRPAALPLLGITPEEDGRTVPETDRPLNDKARQQVRDMPADDKLKLIQSIRESNVGREDKIPWQRVTDVPFRKRYNRAARELVWSRLKRSVPNYHRKSVRQICEYLIKQYDADQRVGQGWDLDYGEAEEGEEETLSALPTTSDIVKTMAAAKARTRPGINGSGKAFKSNEFVAESDSEKNNGNGNANEIPATAGTEIELPTKRPRAPRRTAAARVNGGAEKHVSESESESDQEQVEDDIEDVDEEEDAASEDKAAAASSARKSRAAQSAREASVDLSMGEGLPSEGAGGEESRAENGDDGNGSFPLTLSLSPSLAKHKPRALGRSLGRPLNAAKQGGQKSTSGNGIEGENGENGENGEGRMSAMAKRFRQDGAAASFSAATTPTPAPKHTNGEVLRTKKRTLGSAQWQAASAGGGGEEIEDVSDDGRRNGGDSARTSLPTLGRAGDGPRPAKRLRQYHSKRAV